MRALMVLIALIFPLSAHAITFNVTDSNSDFIEINQGGTKFRIFLDTLRPGSRTLITADLLTRISAFTQVRLEKASIPELDEPTRMVDPGRLCGPGETRSEHECGFGEKFFWCLADGTPTVADQAITTHVCAQGSLVSEAFWDGTKYILSIRVTRDCAGNPEFPSCQLAE